ncbi:beta-defensin 126-like [Erinaceus europaeus]|uniref:Beta-defensin 126-like n=1 Tax=Erinaceus europaeus TaxID=9365 RepID=A0ABM3Y9L9_ERIEU|nr:beta-defensin 126-like [Erinaceus europaeus]
MKSSLLTLALLLLLVKLASGNWYVRKCANRLGTCKKMCSYGETQINPVTGMCNREKLCCVPRLQNDPLLCGDGDGDSDSDSNAMFGRTSHLRSTSNFGGGEIQIRQRTDMIKVYSQTSIKN